VYPGGGHRPIELTSGVEFQAARQVTAAGSEQDSGHPWPRTCHDSFVRFEFRLSPTCHFRQQEAVARNEIHHFNRPPI
jgi:hypothetical protein